MRDPALVRKRRSATTPRSTCPQNLDPEGLPIVVMSLCSTGTDQKVYARKASEQRCA
jgi:hypothetical protein